MVETTITIVVAGPGFARHVDVVVQQKLRTDTKLVQFGLSIQIKEDAPELAKK